MNKTCENVKLVLAPLADFTDAPFRKMCFDFGADMAYTEMVSAAALAHGHAATRILLESLPGEGPLGCQIFGANPSDVANAAKIVSLPQFCEINLNAGCPMDKVTRSGAGAKLAESPEKVYELLVAIKENTSLPITLKTRLGPNPHKTTVFELVDAAYRAGCSGVTVHARWTSQLHGGDTHLDLLAEAVRRSPIPVTGNGSIRTRNDLQAMLATGIDAVMIGRAAIAEPEIFSLLRGKRKEPPSMERARRLFTSHMGYLIDFHAKLVAHLTGCRIPELNQFVALKARTHLSRYFAGTPGAAAIRASFNTAKTIADILAILDSL